MGVVDTACQEFLDAVKEHMAVSLKTTSRFQRRMNKLTMRSLQRIQMTIGKTKCTENFILTGMSVYLDNYFSAALWP